MVPNALWSSLLLLLAELGCSPANKVITGWIHQNDYEKALLSVAEHRQFLAEVAPAWYAINADGDIEKRDALLVGDSRVKGLSVVRNIRLVPLLMNVSPSGSQPERVRRIFSDKEARQKHLEQIERLISEDGYAGIDLDYEGLSASEMTPLAELVEEIAKPLHFRGKMLSVSLETQANDNALPGWKRIGQAADRVRIMTYGVRVSEPGPLISLEWMEDRLQKILQVVPKEKLIHGIAIYGLTWKRGSSGNRSGTWEQLLKPALDQGIPIERDSITSTPWYFNGEETVWCEDAESVRKKMEISWGLGIRQFAFWRLGGEDPKIWPMIAGFLEEKRKEQ